MPLWSALPFVGLLLSVALIPLLREEWWHHNRNKAFVSFGFGIAAGIFVAFRDPHALGHAALEYLAFVSLLGSLFIISGGLFLKGTLSSTPAANTVLLAFGAVLANFVGTTGAAMLLIRPFLRANQARRSKTHLLLFFILIVANCGGCLTPLGDPPLFLGFLKGVPFLWTLTLWKEWLLVCGLLLAVFYVVDRRNARREAPVTAPREPLGLEGKINLLALVGVISAVLAGGFWVMPRHGETAALVFQTASLSTLAVLSILITPRGVREANEFKWHPFVEVAVLFIGIFAAMIPALSILQTRGESLGITRSAGYFWATGVLSSLLDNAPTYLAFLSMSQYLPDEVAGTTATVLSAISTAAVFFGSLTYIGNGPNFMIKAIAEHSGIKMPSFLGYAARACAVMIPILALVTLIFFRK